MFRLSRVFVFLSILFFTGTALADVTCSVGEYLPANQSSCATCTAGSYCVGGTFAESGSNQGITQCTGATWSGAGASSCTACPTGYNVVLPNGKTDATQCRIQVLSGNYIANPYDSTPTLCPAGYSCPTANINYGNTGSLNICTNATYSAEGSDTCTACPSGYTSNYVSGKTLISQCQLLTTAGRYIDTAYSTNQPYCKPGSYCPSTYINYGSIGGNLLCQGATYTANSGNYVCNACPDGYDFNLDPGKNSPYLCQANVTPGYYISSGVQTICTSAYYCPGGVINGDYSGRTLCPTSYTSGGTGLSAENQCKILTNLGTYISTAYSTTGTTCTAGSYCPATLVAYGDTGGIFTCPTGYDDGGTGVTAQNQCKIQTTDGYYISTANSTDMTVCPAGSYCAAALVSYGSIGSILPCTGATYSDEGTSSCLPCPTGYTSNTTNGKTSITQCQLKTNNGQYIATAYSNTQTSCPAGYRCPSTDINYGSTGSIFICTGATYTAGGSASCSTCPGSYTANVTDGKTASNQCQIQTNDGTYIASTNSSTLTTCTAGYYCLATLINYGSVGGRTSCPTSYVNGGTGLTAQNQCAIQTTAGRYIAVANDTTQTLCTAGYYCPSALILYGNTNSMLECTGATYSGSSAGSCTACPGSYTADTTPRKTAQNQCKIQTNDGYYIASGNSSTQTLCLAGYACPASLVSYNSTGALIQCTGATYAPAGSSSCSACPTGYENNTTAGKSAITQCQLTTTAGKYIDTANSTTLVTCLAGYACPVANVNYGSTGSITQCTGAMFSGPGQSSCTGCPSSYTANTDPGKTLASQCQLQTTAGRFISTANSTSQTDCTAGYYCPSTLVNYGSTGLRIQCTGQTYSSSRQSECTACPVDYDDNPADGKTGVAQCQIQTTAGNWISTSQATEQTSCTVGYYCPGSVMVGYSQTGGRTACPTNYDDAPAGASTQNQCGLQTSAGYYIPTANSTTQTACTSGYYCPSVLVYYGQTGSRLECPTGYINGGSYVRSIDECTFRTSGGYYIANANDTTQTICIAGYSCPSTYVGYGSTGTITQCTGATYSGAGAATCTACASGYNANIDDGKTVSSQCQIQTTAGKFIASPNSTTQTDCTAGYYCPVSLVNYGSTGLKIQCTGQTYSGVGQSECSVCPVDYDDNLSDGKTEITQCQIQTIAGNYIAIANDTTQTICPDGYYCPSSLVSYGTVGGNTACPTNYDDGGSGLSAQNQCVFQTTQGYSIINVNSTTQTLCGAGYYCPAAAVSYGSTGSRFTCPTNYDDGGTGLYAQNQCKFQVAAGRYIKTAGDSSTTNCEYGSFCAGALVAYGDTGVIEQCTGATYSASGATSCTNCPNGYDVNTDPGKTSSSSCQFRTTAGYFLQTANSTTQTICTAGYYCPSVLINYGNIGTRINCPGFYDNGGTGATSENQCQIQTAAGKYIATEYGLPVGCTAGSYCPASLVNYGSTGSITQCSAGTYSAASASSCTSCITGSYSDVGASACIACQDGTTTSSDGSALCDANCSGDNGYDISWTTAIWNTNNTVTNLCTIGGCAGGYYLTGGSCQEVGPGYWSLDGSVTRTACPVGLTTIGRGFGADEVGDCGKLIHFDNKQVYLRNTKKTTPSFNVKVDGNTYYGNMTTTTQNNALQVKSSETQYSVYDDSM